MPQRYGQTSACSVQRLLRARHPGGIISSRLSPDQIASELVKVVDLWFVQLSHSAFSRSDRTLRSETTGPGRMAPDPWTGRVGRSTRKGDEGADQPICPEK